MIFDLAGKKTKRENLFNKSDGGLCYARMERAGGRAGGQGGGSEKGKREKGKGGGGSPVFVFFSGEDDTARQPQY